MKIKPKQIIIDVTNQVEFQHNDDECLPLTKCVCGMEYDTWDFILSIYDDNPSICKKCGAKLYFDVKIHVYKIENQLE